MSACCAPPPPSSPSRPSKLGSIAGSVVPAAILIALPKCPACVAAYAAMVGIGLSFSAASALRVGLIAACVLALMAVALRFALSASRRRDRRPA